MILIKLFILLFEFMLVSCNTNTIINHQTANEESEFRSLRTQVISFPNKKSVLYSFSNPKTFLFDYNEFVYLTITKAQNGVDEFIKIESCEWDVFSCKTKGTKHLFSQNDQLNFFIEKLSQIDLDTCLVHNSYSMNSEVNSTIIFVDDKGAIHAIPYMGKLCSFGMREGERTKLESIEYKLREYLMEIGAWDTLIVDHPLETQESKKLEVVDTMYFQRFDMDNRIAKNINLFYPLKSFLFSKANMFIANIDTIPYYKADLEGDSVLYIWNKDGAVRFKDADSAGFRRLLKKLSLYEKEKWEISRKDCPGETDPRYIYWNDSALNIIPFECATEKQNIWHLDKEIKEWFEVKLNAVRNGKR